jgi:hypothetical protein
MKKGNILLVILTGYLILSCTTNPSQSVGNGGGTETVIGKVVDSLGHPVEFVEVKFIEHTHNVLLGIDSLERVDTTDKEGIYRINKISPALYRVVLRDMRTGLRAIRWELPIFAGLRTMELTQDTLRVPGSIVIPVSKGSFSAGGSFYIPGTPWAQVITSAELQNESVSLDSVVNTVVPLLCYRAVSGAPITLAESIAVFENKATVIGSLVPSPWQSASIAELQHGGVLYNNGAMTIIGGGYDIWDVADNFFFVYQPLSTHGEISARLVRTDTVAAFDKAGIMIRQSLDSQSPNVSLCFERFSNSTRTGPSLAFMQRINFGDSTHSAVKESTVLPLWLRLSRNDSLITGFSSVNGLDWDTLGTDTMGITGTLLVGMCVSSHDSVALKKATFDSISVK